MKKSAQMAKFTPPPDGDLIDTDEISPKTSRRVLVNTGAMAGSSLWRILVSFLLQLMVLRILGLEAHGRYTVALAFLNVSQILTELGLQNLLVRNLARQVEDRSHYFRHHFKMSLGLQICASLIVWALLWGLGILFPYTEAMSNILWLVGATLPFYAVTISCQTIFQATERMELVMFIEVIVNTLIGVLSLAILYLQGSIRDLISLLIATQALSALLCLYLLYREKLFSTSVPNLATTVQESLPESAPLQPEQTLEEKENRTSSATPSGVKGYLQLLRESLPFYGLSLSDVLLQRLDILLLSIFAGETIIGIYSAAYNVVRILHKLTQSYWKALYPTLSRLAFQNLMRRQKAGYVTLQQAALKYGLLVLLGIAVVATPAGELILNIIYGSELEADVAATVFRLLIWSAPLYLIELYAITILMAENRPKLSLCIMAVHLVTVALLLPVLTSAYGPQGAGWAVLGATVVGVSLSLVITKRFRLLIAPSKGLWMLLPALLTALCLFLVPLVNLPILIGSFVLYLALVWLCGIVTLADLRNIRSAP